MRKGMNPLKHSDVPHRPPEIVLCAITHLPEQVGYHAERLEIVQTCLTTMREHADGDPFEVYIWDNGSCDELRDWLKYDYQPDYLTLSPNIGKTSARTAIMRTFRPGTIVGISDDDMYFYPNWLKPQIKILTTYPNVGAVSGYPVRTQFKWGNKTTLEWAKKNAELETGRFIPDMWDRDFCDSVGRKYGFHLQYTQNLVDYRVIYKGVTAYATAHHCQFITYAERLEYIVEWNSEATSDERNFDRAIDKEGYLRLTTTDRLTRHMGNVMDDDIREMVSVSHGKREILHIG